MISFHKAEAADRVWAHEILKNCEYPGAEYAFSCMSVSYTHLTLPTILLV